KRCSKCTNVTPLAFVIERGSPTVRVGSLVCWRRNRNAGQWCNGRASAMVKIGRNIVLGWMVSLLGFTRGSPAAMMIMALVLTSTSTWDGESGAGVLVSAAGPEAGAISDAWRQDGDKGVAAAAAGAAGSLVHAGENGAREDAEPGIGSDNAIRPPQQRRRGRRLEPEVG
ncbi:unnamed protein product, partial [Scytosiphon promiscuus]